MSSASSTASATAPTTPSTGARLRRPSQPPGGRRPRHGALARLLHPPPGARPRDPRRLSPLLERARPSAARNLERPRPRLSLHLRQRGALVHSRDRNGQPYPRRALSPERPAANAGQREPSGSLPQVAIGGYVDRGKAAQRRRERRTEIAVPVG